MIGWIDAGLGGVTAGFTTRAGGVSTGAYDSLNLGLNVGDAPEAVMANRRALGEHVGAPVAFAHQVHGRTVVEVESPDAAASADVGDADVLLTCRDDVAIAVLWADCVPVLLVDPERRVVAAAHAGRAGLVGGAVEAAVDAMVERGCSPQVIRAAVGPCIRPEHYEVPSELRDEVDAVVPGTAAVTSWGSPAVDLAAGVAAVLRGCGVSSIVDLRLSTWSDERFYSHRRSEGGPTGRGAAVIRLLPPGRVLPGVGADAG